MTAGKEPVHVRTEWLGNRRFKAESGAGTGGPVWMDCSADHGGHGLGSSPMELLLMGLIGCLGMGVTQLLAKMRQSPEALEITAEGIRSAQSPHEITEIHLTFHVQGQVAPARIWKAVMLECGHYCPVAASLKANMVPHIVLNGEQIPPPID